MRRLLCLDRQHIRSYRERHPWQHGVVRTRRWIPFVVCVLAICWAPGILSADSSQKQSPSAADIMALIDQAAKYQVEDYYHRSTWALRYRVHRKDDKEDSVRDLVESTEGNVARTLQRNGMPLSPEEQLAEEQRLKKLTPEDLERHRHGSQMSDKFGVDIISAMPRAMIYTLVPGQPQLPQFSSEQVVLDYAPDPQFHPASTAQELLSGMAGRLWIDAETHHVLRMEIHIIKNLNLAFGILARVYQGGKVNFEQLSVGAGHYGYSHIDIDVRLRELMVRTVPYRLSLDATDVVLLTSPPTLADAIDLLLSPSPSPAPQHHE